MGPNGEPLACGYLSDHDGPHSWSSLPSFAAARPTVPEEPDEGRRARLVEKTRALAAGEPCPSCGMRHADPLDLLEEPGA